MLNKYNEFVLVIMHVQLKLNQCRIFGILLGSPLAVAKAAATLPGVHAAISLN